MEVGNHGYPSVEKMVVVGSYAAKAVVLLPLPPMAQVVAMEICVKERYGIIPNGITWQPCMVREMVQSSRFMWTVSSSTNSKEWAVFLGRHICSYLEQGITIITVV